MLTGKEEDYMIIVINTEKSCDKMQQMFMMKN